MSGGEVIVTGARVSKIINNNNLSMREGEITQKNGNKYERATKK